MHVRIPVVVTDVLCNRALASALRPVKEPKRILRKLTGFRMTWKSPLVIAVLSVSQTWPMSRETTRSRGKPKIKETIRIRLNDHSDEDICRVMLGATYNDMAGEFGGCRP